MKCLCGRVHEDFETLGRCLISHLAPWTKSHDPGIDVCGVVRENWGRGGDTLRCFCWCGELWHARNGREVSRFGRHVFREWDAHVAAFLACELKGGGA